MLWEGEVEVEVEVASAPGPKGLTGHWVRVWSRKQIQAGARPYLGQGEGRGVGPAEGRQGGGAQVLSKEAGDCPHVLVQQADIRAPAPEFPQREQEGAHRDQQQGHQREGQQHLQ
jgi:hypothetical protein